MRKKNSAARKLTLKEKRDLDVEIGFLEGIVKRDPGYADALQVLGDDYTRRGRHAEGLKIDEHLVKLRPADPMAHYNLACSYSLTNRIDLAALALEKALRLGYRDFKWLAEDPDLENLRQDPQYRKIRAKLKALHIKVR
jgi:tetratricopeptide (TPR) repeat protein